MNDDNILGEMLEQGKTQLKQGLKTATSQITGQNINGSTNNQASSEADTKEVVKSFYAKSEPDTSNTSALQQNSEQPKTPEDLEKLAKARQELQRQHTETYYDPTFNRRPEERQEEEIEEKQKEKEEEEKKMELMQEKAKKDEDLAVQHAAQKAEKFPGISG